MRYWAGRRVTVMADRRVLVSYIQAKLTGADMTSYDIQTRNIPERTVSFAIEALLHLHAHPRPDAFFSDAFTRLRSAAPGVEGIAGAPFLVFYGEVSDDSDGPIELCRHGGLLWLRGSGCGRGVQVRVELLPR